MATAYKWNNGAKTALATSRISVTTHYMDEKDDNKPTSYALKIGEHAAHGNHNHVQIDLSAEEMDELIERVMKDKAR